MMKKRRREKEWYARIAIDRNKVVTPFDEWRKYQSLSYKGEAKVPNNSTEMYYITQCSKYYFIYHYQFR